ncbi:hypothetical protein Tsp_10069 [Trichinella spiralis]|uniref:hypothetical protein n=1 Tax=Trichinella spiralis TaxID=6334 RepID=UPI0001EFCF3E|nr:hypothetical protein Tsp_10069 [Trichinella spiralis]
MNADVVASIKQENNTLLSLRHDCTYRLQNKYLNQEIRLSCSRLQFRSNVYYNELLFKFTRAIIRFKNVIEFYAIKIVVQPTGRYAELVVASFNNTVALLYTPARNK